MTFSSISIHSNLILKDECFTYRLATENDNVDETVKTVNDGYATVPYREPTAPRTNTEEIRKLIADKDRRALYIAVNNKDSSVCGTVKLYCEENNSDHACFGMFTVRPDLQKRTKGVAARLLGLAEIVALQAGFKSMKLDNFSNEKETHAYYERRGYRDCIGKREPVDQDYIRSISKPEYKEEKVEIK